MNLRTLVRHLGVPSVVVALFSLSALYQQEIFVQLGLATWEQLRTTALYVFQVGLWLSLAYLIGRIADIVIWDQVSRRVAVPRLMRDVTRVLIFMIAISGIVAVVFKRPVAPFWTASGAAGIIVGFALRNVIVDVFMGLAINLENPFKIGDYIQIANGPAGQVVELNWRTTRLLTPEGHLAVVPNGKLGELTVTNYSRPDDTGEMEFTVTLDSTIPAERALRILTAAAMRVTGTSGVLEEPAPKARIRAFSGNGVEYKIKFQFDPRIAGPGKARHAVMLSVLDLLHLAGLHPAVNTQEVIQGAQRGAPRDPASLVDRAALLQRTELFAGFDAASLEHLASRMQQRTIAAGDPVVREGEPGDSMFVILEGLLYAEVGHEKSGERFRLAQLGAGDFFGEISALTGDMRSATMTAATDALVFEIPQEAFASLLATRPELLEQLGAKLVMRRGRWASARSAGGTAAAPVDETGPARQMIARMESFFQLTPAPPPIAIGEAAGPVWIGAS